MNNREGWYRARKNRGQGVCGVGGEEKETAAS
jgi:hypothetical protein